MLNKIIENKRAEIAKAKEDFPFEEMLKKIDSPDFKKSCLKRDFKKAIENSHLALIAEVKQKSPSCPKFRDNFDYLKIAQIYARSGAKAISVLTDKSFFGGELKYLSEIKQNTALPVLRKDFIIDEYQIYQSLFYKADAVLFIACLLDEKKLENFLQICRQLNLDALVETHNCEDLQKVLNTSAEIIGINNRNLDSLEIDLKTTEKLIKLIPKGKVIVSESGIKTKEDIKYLGDLGINAVLIGETLLKSEDIEEKIRDIMGDVA